MTKYWHNVFNCQYESINVLFKQTIKRGDQVIFCQYE